MAGSYGHIVQKDGNLRSNPEVVRSLETGGDVWETVEEMYGMIWYMAAEYAYLNPKSAVDEARRNYREGLKKAKEINE